MTITSLESTGSICVFHNSHLCISWTQLCVAFHMLELDCSPYICTTGYRWVWPEQHVYVLFLLTMLYFVVHLIMGYWDLYDCLDDVDMTVINVLETMVLTSNIFALIIVRHTKKLEKVIIMVKKEVRDAKSFENLEEKRLYLNYNSISCRFAKYWTIVSFITIYLIYLRPLIHLITSYVLGNGTNPYHLPFRAHIVFDFREPGLYTLVYVFQLPVTYISMCHVAVVSLIVSLVLHLCGRLSILSYRIQNIRTKPLVCFKEDIRRTVTTHLELIGLAETLNDTFHLILLTELLNCCFRMGLALYIVLLKFSTEPIVAYNFLLYAADVGGFLFVFSYVGEQLMHKSQNVAEAFYNLDWPDVESSDRKDLLMCIMNGQKTMTIMAGRFYTFSLYGFTGIMKTSMASLSMLRARM
ncbi:odorant receptor 43a-like [Ptiloglossa arizonensis]|uniref:odorant receptor 43a-like n=1 Tax=Ptiloglossa arizonensis TaxID=3350558 RepID=UPI003FA168F5